MRSFWLYCITHELEIIREINNAINDPGPKSESCGRSGISNPTEAIAIRHMTVVVKEVKINDFYVVRYPQDVIRTIRYIRACVNLNEELGAIYRARFIDKEKWNVTCERLHISGETYNRRLKKIFARCDKYFKSLRGVKK